MGAAQWVSMPSADTWHMVLHMVLHPRIQVSCSERCCLMRMEGAAAAESSLAQQGHLQSRASSTEHWGLSG